MALPAGYQTIPGNLKVDADGRLYTTDDAGAPTHVSVDAFPTTTTGTVTAVASSATSVTVLASNASAKARKVFNDSTQILYLKFGTTASSTSFTVKVQAQGYYEFPNPLFTGRVDGIWASAQGNALTTEET